MSEKTSDDEKVVSECECLQRSEKTGIICTVDLPVVLSIAGGIVGLVGGVAGLLSWLNQRKQTTILQGQLAVMREQLQSAKHQEGTATEWARSNCKIRSFNKRYRMSWTRLRSSRKTTQISPGR